MSPSQQPLFSTREHELPDFVALFVSELPDRVGAMRIAFERGNFTLLERLALLLRDAGPGYGFPEIGPLAGRLCEQVGREEPDEAIEETLEELLALCRRVRINVPGRESAWN